MNIPWTRLVETFYSKWFVLMFPRWNSPAGNLVLLHKTDQSRISEIVSKSWQKYIPLGVLPSCWHTRCNPTASRIILLVQSHTYLKSPMPLSLKRLSMELHVFSGICFWQKLALKKNLKCQHEGTTPLVLGIHPRHLNQECVIFWFTWPKGAY